MRPRSIATIHRADAGAEDRVHDVDRRVGREPRPPPQEVERLIHAHPVKPSGKPRTLPESSEVFDQLHEHVLGDLEGIIAVAREPVRNPEDSVAVPPEQIADGFPPAGQELKHQAFVLAVAEKRVRARRRAIRLDVPIELAIQSCSPGKPEGIVLPGRTQLQPRAESPIPAGALAWDPKASRPILFRRRGFCGRSAPPRAPATGNEINFVLIIQR